MAKFSGMHDLLVSFGAFVDPGDQAGDTLSQVAVADK